MLLVSLLSGCGRKPTLPNVVGLALDKAHQQLKAAGYEKFNDDDYFEDRASLRDANWAVIQQSPSPGQALDTDSEITLKVGKIAEDRTIDALPDDSEIKQMALRKRAEEAAEEKAAAERSAVAGKGSDTGPSPSVSPSPSLTQGLSGAERKAAVACQSRPPAGEEIFVRFITTDGPPTATRLGGGWVWDFGDKKCITPTVSAIKGNPPLPGFCTQVAYVSANPGYDPNEVPAPRLHKVIAAGGDC